MKITGHSTVDTVLRDPEASEWLKAALRSALELKCDPTDVYKDADPIPVDDEVYVANSRSSS